MMTSFESSIVRVYASSGSIVGTGFLVGKKQALTCAHVICAALGLQDGTAIPETEINLDFPLIAPGKLIKGKVVIWLPYQSDGSGDIAGLELDGEIPERASIARLVAADDVWDHRFRAYGFPASREKSGVWAAGVLRAQVAFNWLQIEATKGTGYAVEPGFSGGAVWDDELQGVVGMVIASDLKKDARSAFAIPSRLLINSWPIIMENSIPPCPYRGLFTFQEQHAAYYFGRDNFARKLVSSVEKEPLIAIIGVSGSGKSSVVMAGLVPNLRASGNWQITKFRPGSAPFGSLAEALIPFLMQSESKVDQLAEGKKLAEHIKDGTLTLGDVVNNIVNSTNVDGRFLLVIDQFEELYSPQVGVEAGQRFLDTLLATIDPMSKSYCRQLSIVITLRADFLSQAMSYSPFAAQLQQHSLLLPAMNRSELEQAIRLPADKLGVGFEQGLVERILKTIIDQPGTLPLLEFALTLLWGKQERKQMTHVAYQIIGEVEGALAKYANDVYENQLSDAERAQCQHVFVQMIQPGKGGPDTRRVASINDFDDDDWSLIQRLANARLVVVGTDDNGETAEIVHETLIHNWELLHTWMEDSRNFRAWQERLRDSLSIWSEDRMDALLKGDEKSRNFLLKGILLEEAKRFLLTDARKLGEDERNFVFHSMLHHSDDDKKWIAYYGSVKETVQFLTQYLNSESGDVRRIGIITMRYIPRSDLDGDIHARLENMLLTDRSPVVRNEAAHTLCQLGQTARLAQLLDEEIPDPQKKNIVAGLAYVRNIQGLGVTIKNTLQTYKIKILLHSTLGLIWQYKNEFAVVMFFAYLASTFTNYGMARIFQPIESWLNVNGGLPFSELNLIGLTGAGLFLLIRRNRIDGQEIPAKYAIWISVIGSLIAESIYLFGRILELMLRFSLSPTPSLITNIMSIFMQELTDMAGLSIISIGIISIIKSNGRLTSLVVYSFLGSATATIFSHILVSPLISLLSQFMYNPAQPNTFESLLAPILTRDALLNTLFVLLEGFLIALASLLGFKLGIQSIFQESQAISKPE